MKVYRPPVHSTIILVGEFDIDFVYQIIPAARLGHSFSSFFANLRVVVWCFDVERPALHQKVPAALTQFGRFLFES